MINDSIIRKEAEKYDSYFLYDEETIIKNVERLKNAFKGIIFLYSVKANPNPYVVDTIFSHGFLSDAASLGEVKLSKAHGLKNDEIFYSTPGKSKKEIEECLEDCVLIADSLNEIRLINEIAGKREKTVKIGVRINPDFTYTENEGHASKFGVDEKQFFEFASKELPALKNIKVVGMHTHVKSQELNTDYLIGYHKNVLKLAVSFGKAVGELEFINLGSGIGLPFGADDTEVDVERLGAELSKRMNEFREEIKNSLNHKTEISIYMESGRYPNRDAGIYVSKVLDKKVSYGQTFLILKNTFNGFARPVYESTLLHFCDSPSMYEPFFTRVNAFSYRVVKADEESCAGETGNAEHTENAAKKDTAGEMEKVNLAGCLCTGIDQFATQIELEKAEPGDIVVMTNAGCYAATLSPLKFSSHENYELFLSKDGGIIEYRL